MELLSIIIVWHNNVEIIDEDALRDLPNLNHFNIEHNKVKRLEASTFDKNYKLTHIIADSNQLEFLPDNLFENNILLEEVSFKNNNLKVISEDFTKFKSIKKIDFRGNNCIDKSWDDVSVLSEFQSIVNHQCSRIGARHIFS